MANDLPNRPKPDPAKTSKKIAATDRVKSGANKVNPRFEALKNKAAKEEALRARAKAKAEAAKVAAAEQAEGATEADASEQAADTETKPSKSGFSFNQFSSKRDAS